MGLTTTSWKPGQSGNPNGRPPKGETLTEALDTEFTPQELAEKLRWFIFEKNDFAALKYAYDRRDGKPRETVHNINENLPEVVEIDLSDRDTESS